MQQSGWGGGRAGVVQRWLTGSPHSILAPKHRKQQPRDFTNHLARREAPQSSPCPQVRRMARNDAAQGTIRVRSQASRVSELSARMPLPTISPESPSMRPRLALPPSTASRVAPSCPRKAGKQDFQRGRRTCFWLGRGSFRSGHCLRLGFSRFAPLRRQVFLSASKASLDSLLAHSFPSVGAVVSVSMSLTVRCVFHLKCLS